MVLRREPPIRALELGQQAVTRKLREPFIPLVPSRRSPSVWRFLGDLLDIAVRRTWRRLCGRCLCCGHPRAETWALDGSRQCIHCESTRPA